MKKILVALLLLSITSCSPSVEKKIGFLKQATILLNQSKEFTEKIYSAKIFERQITNERLQTFYKETEKLNSIGGWGFSDSVRSNLLDLYKTDIRNNLIIDSLQKINSNDVYLKVVELVIPVVTAKDNITLKMKDQTLILSKDLK